MSLRIARPVRGVPLVALRVVPLVALRVVPLVALRMVSVVALRMVPVVVACVGLPAPVLCQAPAAAVGSEDVMAPRLAPERRLALALQRRYACDLRARIRLEIHGRSGALRTRILETASKQRDGRMHALGRVLEPEHLRGLTILTVEAEGRTDDAFLHLPALGRTRRVSGSRSSESFLGSDLTFADLERHRLGDYEVLAAEPVDHMGEAATRIRTRRREAGGHPGVDFVVADADLAILAMLYRNAAGGLERSVQVPRHAIRSFGPHRIPTRLQARNHRRGTHTDVLVTRLELAPELDDRLFSLTTLESGRPLPGP